MALIRASLRQVHGPEVVADLSRYYMANEVRETYVGMMVALPPSKWVKFQRLSAEQLADLAELETTPTVRQDCFVSSEVRAEAVAAGELAEIRGRHPPSR